MEYIGAGGRRRQIIKNMIGINIKTTTFLVILNAMVCNLVLVNCQQTSSVTGQSRSRNSLGPKLSRSPASSQQQATASTPTISNQTLSNLQAARSSSNGRLQATSFNEDELPADFYELPAEQLDLGMNATGRAPVPILNVAVLQNGQPIDNAINVHPGTPLEMVIYLDDKSAKVYGLLVSYLKVQDNTQRLREEVIIQNGCSIDTHIFENFELIPEDKSLRARFKAFKFPESNFVRFVGTVNVCIKQCPSVNCAGKRRKRAVSANSASKDDRLVMTVSTVLRIG